ncbi:hypothetical protein HOD83_03875 [Candidatus Woesearchaeota archaeon]|jgi:hypothetical protein|nr:hypothetical protein [Candidatus Woesearchaeota archaeon]MBT4114472.1 hypothetical protein [Candidatus Woesearchaeota archaeon]MBT4248687.1 hypothetical protein [Candidatus Woesearchaeota archaeon]
MKKEIIIVLFITAIVFVSGCLGSGNDADDSDNSERDSGNTDGYADENGGNSDVDTDDLTPPALPE